MIIGILGRSRVGKDTVASILMNQYGANQAMVLRLSQPLKDAVQALYGFTRTQIEDDAKDKIDPRFGITPREVIQHFCRDMMLRHGEDFFSRRMYEDEIPKYKNKTVIIPDVRFAHDIRLIHDQGGIILKVMRPNGPHPTHFWESPIDNMRGDYEIINDAGIEHLQSQVHALNIHLSK